MFTEKGKSMKNFKLWFKRTLTILMASALVLSSVPTSAYASGTEGHEGTIIEDAVYDSDVSETENLTDETVENDTETPGDESVDADELLEAESYFNLSGKGSENDPWIIEDVDDWNMFANYICIGYNFKDCYFKLSSIHDFKGNNIN